MVDRGFLRSNTYFVSLGEGIDFKQYSQWFWEKCGELQRFLRFKLNLVSSLKSTVFVIREQVIDWGVWITVFRVWLRYTIKG